MKKLKLLLFIGISLVTSSCKPSMAIPKNPLMVCENCNNWIENKLITLLDQVISGKRYWLTIEDRSWYRLMTRPLHHWITFSWKTEIQEHISHLDALQNKLAIRLGKQVGYSQDSETEAKEDIHELILEAHKTLKTHGIPFHIARHWMFYAGSMLCGYKILEAYNNYLSTHVNFVFKEEDKITVLKALQDSMYPHNLTHDKFSHKMWVTSSIGGHQEELEEKLKVYGLSNDGNDPHYHVHQLTPADVQRWFLDSDGTFIGKTFTDTCLINPIKNIWNKLKRESNTKETAYSLEQQEKNLATERKLLIDLLHFAAQTEPNKYPDIKATLEQYKTFNNLSDETLVKLRGSLDTTLGDLIKRQAWEAAQEYVENAEQQKDNSWFATVVSLAGQFVPKETTPRPDTFKTKATRYWLSVVQTRYPLILHSTEKFLSALDFLTESAKMTPFFLATYLAGRGIKNTTEWHRTTYFKEPLRDDLKDFINFLDENLYTHVTNPAYKGLHYYWVSRLKGYKSFMSSKNRIYFEKDLQKLTRGSTLNHDIDTLRAILYHELDHL